MLERPSGVGGALAQSQMPLNLGILEPICCRFVFIIKYDVSLSFASMTGLAIIRIFFQTLKIDSYGCKIFFFLFHQFCLKTLV